MASFEVTLYSQFWVIPEARRYARLSRPTGGFDSAAAEGRCGVANARKPPSYRYRP
jgi:hypothetical protein